MQKGLYEIVQNAVNMTSQSIWSSEPLYYKNWVTKPKHQPAKSEKLTEVHLSFYSCGCFYPIDGNKS